GRPEREHHRLRGAAHPLRDRYRRLLPGREVAAQELRQGPPRPARQALRARTRKTTRRARRHAAEHGGNRRRVGKDSHLQLPAGSPHRSPPELHAPQPGRGARRRHPRPAHRLPKPLHGPAARGERTSEPMSEVWTVRKAILWTASYLEKKGS